MNFVGELLLVRFAATAENVACARASVTECLRMLDGVHQDVLDNVRIALTEAIANVVVHAYRGRATAGEFEVEVRGGSGGIEVIVRDDGCGPVPNPTSPGLGMGVPLMASTTSSLEICGGSQGTVVRMRFALAD